MIDTDAIRERLEAATPGPWVKCYRGAAGEEWEIHSDACGPGFCICVVSDADDEANADFIAHARWDIAALLEENSRLKEILLQMAGEEEAGRIIANQYLSNTTPLSED